LLPTLQQLPTVSEIRSHALALALEMAEQTEVWVEPPVVSVTCGRHPAKSGTTSIESRRNKAAIQGGEQAEWPRLVRALADR
jgi:hypothetical protein